MIEDRVIKKAIEIWIKHNKQIFGEATELDKLDDVFQLTSSS